jgi:hypothetical protein
MDVIAVLMGDKHALNVPDRVEVDLAGTKGMETRIEHRGSMVGGDDEAGVG